MDISRYLNTPVTWRKFLGDDNDFNAPEYAEPVTIMCRIDDGVKFKVRENQLEVFNAYTYMTLEKISPRDLLDGNVVIISKPIYKLNGSISHYESVVGEATEL